MTLKNCKVFSIWLIGPSASGKSTLAKALYKEIGETANNIVILDGDNIRDLFENKYGYDAKSRSKVTMRYINLVKWLQNFNISTLVSVISPFEADRMKCKHMINNYKQVYLKCPLETRISRDKKNLYKPALQGLKKNVIDIDIPFEQSKINDVILDTTDQDIKDLVKKVKTLI